MYYIYILYRYIYYLEIKYIEENLKESYYAITYIKNIILIIFLNKIVLIASDSKIK